MLPYRIQVTYSSWPVEGDQNSGDTQILTVASFAEPIDARAWLCDNIAELIYRRDADNFSVSIDRQHPKKGQPF